MTGSLPSRARAHSLRCENHIAVQRGVVSRLPPNLPGARPEFRGLRHNGRRNHIQAYPPWYARSASQSLHASFSGELFGLVIIPSGPASSRTIRLIGRACSHRALLVERTAQETEGLTLLSFIAVHPFAQQLHQSRGVRHPRTVLIRVAGGFGAGDAWSCPAFLRFRLLHRLGRALVRFEEVARAICFLDSAATRADFVEAVRLLRHAGPTLAPTFISFTPWTSLKLPLCAARAEILTLPRH